MRLILFDVDGTLVDARGAGSRALLTALAEVFGRPFARNGVPFAGRTDRAILADLMVANRVSPSEVETALDRAFRALPRLMQVETERTPSVPYPGVCQLLDELDRKDGLALGLLTGNMEATARLKLASAGIDSSCFVVGAYGDESADRKALPPLAVARAEASLGSPVSTAIVVGDTPADIECARSNGMSSLAVATGACSVAELAACHPDYLFPDLTPVGSVLRVLMGDG
jgi:phosphoglycolate phosphatase